MVQLFLSDDSQSSLIHPFVCLLPIVVTFRSPRTFEVDTSDKSSTLTENLSCEDYLLFWLLACCGWSELLPLHSLRQAFLDSQRYPPLRGSQLNWMISHPHNVFGSHSQDNTKRCEEEPLIKQEKSELLVSSQFIGSKHCNILFKMIFLLVLDWPLN